MEYYSDRILKSILLLSCYSKCRCRWDSFFRNFYSYLFMERYELKIIPFCGFGFFLKNIFNWCFTRFIVMVRNYNQLEESHTVLTTVNIYWSSLTPVLLWNRNKQKKINTHPRHPHFTHSWEKNPNKQKFFNSGGTDKYPTTSLQIAPL